MAEDLTHATFRGLVGQTFLIGAEQSDSLPLVLIEANLLHGRSGRTERPPFSLVFRGPRDPWLPQRMYSVWHEALQNAILFLVPMGPGPEGMLYEAIFN